MAFAQLATRSSMRDRFGGLTYPVAAALAVRRYRPFRCTVESDGGTLDLDLVHLSISNATVFGGVLGMRVPGASITDGLLDVIAIERLSIARLALAVADTMVGRHAPVHRVHAFRTRRVRLASDSGDPQPVAADGEIVGELPATFEIAPSSLRVVVPPR